MGLTGLMFVVLSQNETIHLQNNSNGLINLFFGQMLAIIGAVFAGGLVGGCSILWGHTAAKSIPNETMKKAAKDGKDMEILFIMIGLVIGSIPNIIIGGFWGINHEIAKLDHTNMLFPALYGLFALSGALIFSRMANRKTLTLEVNALSYMVPLLSIAWLGFLGYINIPKIEWLVIGSTGVITANAFLNFKNKEQNPYQSLAVILWICGIGTYFLAFSHLTNFYENTAAFMNLKFNCVGLFFETSAFIAASWLIFCLSNMAHWRKNNISHNSPSIRHKQTNIPTQRVALFFCTGITTAFLALLWLKWTAI